jgi:ABC-2 type transport system ATP-binding protein
LRDVRQVCDQVVMLVQGTVRIVDTLENLSRPAEPTLYVAVHGESNAFERRLTQSRYSVVVDSDGSLRIGGVDEADIASIWRLASETGTSIRRLQPAQNSLDKIFFEAASALKRERFDADP